MHLSVHPNSLPHNGPRVLELSLLHRIHAVVPCTSVNLQRLLEVRMPGRLTGLQRQMLTRNVSVLSDAPGRRTSVRRKKTDRLSLEWGKRMIQQWEKGSLTASGKKMGRGGMTTVS